MNYGRTIVELEKSLNDLDQIVPGEYENPFFKLWKNSLEETIRRNFTKAEVDRKLGDFNDIIFFDNGNAEIFPGLASLSGADTGKDSAQALIRAWVGDLKRRKSIKSRRIAVGLIISVFVAISCYFIFNISLTIESNNSEINANNSNVNLDNGSLMIDGNKNSVPIINNSGNINMTIQNGSAQGN